MTEINPKSTAGIKIASINIRRDATENAIYITDLPKSVNFWEGGAKVILYADDLAIICRSRSDLNLALMGLAAFCDEMDLKVNVRKTEVIVFGEEHEIMKRQCPIYFQQQRLEEVEKVTYLGFRMNQALTSADIYRGADIQLLIQIGYIRRWFAIKKDVLPWTLVRSTIIALMRSATTTWLPYVSESEANKLRVREGQMLREVMGASKIHPSISLWNDWGILPVTTQREIQMLSVRDRMESYPEHEPMHDWIEWDGELQKKHSWHKKLPEVPEDLLHKEDYKAHFWEEHEQRTWTEAQKCAAGPATNGRIKCPYYALFLERDDQEFYLDIPLTRAQREAMFTFRASAMGLAHNHEWLYGGSTNCPLCGAAVETEQHLLLRCSALRLQRAKLQADFPWFNRIIAEDDEAWLRRLILHADLQEFAKVILHLRNTRLTKLKLIGFNNIHLLI
jgi:hypothetical protein